MKIKTLLGLSLLSLTLSLASCELPGDIIPEVGSSSEPEISFDNEYGESPITKEIEAAAEAYDYTFDPTKVVVEKQETYNFESAELKAVSEGAESREGKHLVYFFEGSYADGYQGTYTTHYSYFYLYEDGIFTAKISEVAIKGYWYNKANGKECLEIVSSYDHYEHIEFESTGGTSFYTHAAYVLLQLEGRQRSMVVSGCLYYPDVAIFISTEDEVLPSQKGDAYSRDLWVVLRVMKNLHFSAVIKQDEIEWTDPEGLRNGAHVNNPGDYVVTAKWHGLEANVKFSVK